MFSRPKLTLVLSLEREAVADLARRANTLVERSAGMSGWAASGGPEGGNPFGAGEEEAPLGTAVDVPWSILEADVRMETKSC